MRPVRTASTNAVFVGPPGVRDLHAQLLPDRIRTVWHLTRLERAEIANGANLAIEIVGAVLPPLNAVITGEVGEGEDSPDVLSRLEELQER
jgi:hypothetical protein